MSYLERMKIQGIRSFGQDDRDAQVVYFSPLTLILGPNGSGKTTIIECLKYLTTGEMPPNSAKGGSFVHDPKIARETEVKGQIKLKFIDIQGKVTVATRSLLAVQTYKGISVKTLDSVVNKKLSTDDSISLTSKCADIDKEIVSSLGVPKAVLTNVIFCHQEDSNWPLSEGKALKEKFDEIFDASRYIKALDTIKKVRKTKMDDLKLLENDAKYLKQNKMKASQIQGELKSTEARFNSASDKVKELEEKLSPLQSELEEIVEKEGKIFEFEKEFAQLKAVLSEQQQKKDELERCIRTFFEGSKDELEIEINNFNVELESKQRNLITARQKHDSVLQRIKGCEIKKYELQKTVSKLEIVEEQHNKRVKDRNEKLSSLINTLNCDIEFDYDARTNPDKVTEALNAVTQKVNKVLEEEQEMRKKCNKAVESIQKKIDNLKMDKSKIEQAIQMNKDTLRKHELECKSLQDKIKRVASSSTTLYELDANIVCLESELDSLVTMTDVDSLSSEIENLKERKMQFEGEVRELNGQMDQLQRDSVILAELGLQEKDKITKEEKMQKVIRRHSDTLKQLLGNVPSESMQEKLQRYTVQCEQEINQLQSEQSKQKSKLTTLLTSRDLESKQLKIKEEDLNRCREQIMNACGTQDFDECLNKLQSTINELQNDKGALIGSRFLFTKYVEKIEEEDCCPLCHRGFQEKSESEELVSELKEQLDRLPYKLECQDKVLNEKQQKLHELLALKSVLKNVDQLSKEIPLLRQKLLSQSEEINRIQGELSELQKELDSKQWNLQSAQSVQRDSILYDQAQSDIRALEGKMNILKSRLTQRSPSKPVEVVRNELSKKQAELETLRTKIENNQKTINKYYGDAQKLKEQINKMKEEKLQLSTEIQQQATYEERLSKVTNEKRSLELTIQSGERELSEKRRDIESIEKEKADTLKANENDLKVISSRVIMLTEQLKALKTVTEDIELYVKGGKTAYLVKCRDNMKSLEEELKTLQDNKNTASQEYEALQQYVSSHQMQERELRDNLQLLDCRAKIASLNKDLDQLQEKLGSVSAKNFMKRKRELQGTIQRLYSERQQSDGRYQELKLQIEKLKRELNDDLYRDAHKKYREKHIDCWTTKACVDDLAKYYKALDYAVMAYHSKKMREINDIVRELWQNSYNGSDIDYIEIRSDDQGSSLEKRRNYNYRVVMVKGDVALDMRGRCSAGQKVLASIIIRLALAESFCINCGVFALDEPTTNLDRDHIDALAVSLKGIVQSRSQQKNFQLIIITHDEDFVHVLAADQPVDYVQCVKKDTRNLSKITRSKISDVR